MIIRSQPLSRRSVLRGMMGAGVVSIALPPLEAFFTSSTAQAQQSSYPTRFGIFSWGNGVHPQHWIPDEVGEVWTPKSQVIPFERILPKISVISGMEVKAPNNDAHNSGPAGLLSGVPVVYSGDGHSRFGGPSLDQMIAAEKGGDTPFRSLEVAVEPNAKGLSFSGRDTRLPPESDLISIFQRLFGPQFRAPGDDPIIDPRLALRRSVLDVVMAENQRLSQKLGAADRIRLDQHLTAIRDLEVRISRLQDDPPNLMGCVKPGEPEPLPPREGRPQMSARSRVMSDLMVMALTCDLTRVCSYWYSDPLSDVLYPDASAGHHQLTHDEPGDMPTVNRITESIMYDAAYFLERLDSVVEGDGTLLDHSAFLLTTDVSYARTHQIDEYPILIAGQASGRIKSGIHYRSETKENACMVSLTLARAMGLALDTFGRGPDETSQSLSVLEVL